MGIEKFFNSIKQNYHIIYKLNEQKLTNKNLFFDFNSIIHVISQYVIHDLNSILKSLINKEEPDKFLLSYYQMHKQDPKKFSEYWSYDKVSDLIIEHIRRYLVLLIDSDFKKVDLIYIALDGVPSLAKMLEQKKRRYNGFFYSKYKQEIINKFKLSENEKLFNKLKISWSKMYISPGTHFMTLFEKKLKDFNLGKNVIISTSQEEGEAEFKIFRYIKDNNIDDVVIYSPDADVILLSLLLNLNNIQILRYNQQESSSPNNFVNEVIDVSKLYKTILEYYDDNNIIEDIVFIFTFFGNDFLPKIKSYNAKLDIELIIELYKNYFNENKKYLIENSKNLNLENFKLFLKELLKYEKMILNRNKLIHDYINYMNLIYNINPNKYHYLSLEDIKEYIKNYNASRLRDQKIDFVPEELHEFILQDFTYIKFNKKLQHIKIQDIKVLKLLNNTHSSNTFYHKNKMFNLSDLEKEIYKLDNLLDDYYAKFNKPNLNHDMNLYLNGLFWVVNYYYNDVTDNSWFYNYSYKYTIQEIYDGIDQFKRIKPDLNINFNIKEQILFVTPYDLIFDDPKILSNINKDKSKFTELIKKEKKIIENINCTDADYFNKCIVEFNIDIHDIKKLLGSSGGSNYIKKYNYYKNLYNKDKKFIHKYKMAKYKLKL